MRIGEACQQIARARGQRVIVATMGAMFAFDALGVTERRLSSVPLMGGAAGLGLGLALANPAVGVVIVDGDASLLMQLGGLVTVADSGVTNFIHFVVQNGAQFAGTSNLPVPGGDTVDFCAMALAAGYASAHTFDEPGALADALPALLAATGPTFVALKIEPEAPRFGPDQQQPEMPDRQFQRMGMEAEQLGVWYASVG
ncbi:thiamine pyrophosphate-dependent enzyme [Paraburkholderia sp. DHOC27]|uniref:thiamine pyrophosphate-dependent enzyme n=1 Tax=Paraburkholderia sp. DHOC27 TaxID=2303330 RepID=UPI000E3D40A9|nr:thiamine pyrophosphate-dependent enzyme [Paraburkholderia sp. DHOC27]RFU44788.1 thiamine pyrophosphate-binding protein [Paraburkholderia sp. DHOC27]